jgi:hypothetical protein
MAQCLRCGREMGQRATIIACGRGAIWPDEEPSGRDWQCHTYCSWECMAGRTLRRCPKCEQPTPPAVAIGTGIPYCMNCNHPLAPEAEVTEEE